MKIYFAGAESGLKDLKANGVSRLLITMASGERHFPKARTEIPACDLLIDSGAFTFQTKGDIPLSNWIAMAHRVKPFGNEIIALDVIGDPKKTYENFQEIIKEIPDAIPTFHVGSSLLYLEKYLQYTNRIAIGGMVPYKLKIQKLFPLLDDIFVLFKSNIPKFHAFGIFNQQILQKYPFYSADATTWQNANRFGEIQRLERGKFIRRKSVRVGGASILKNCHVNDVGIYLNDDKCKRSSICIASFLQFEKYLTRLWSKRGIIWTD